mgnify:CR=1 FL=1
MIDEPPLLTVRRRPPPPSAELLQPFRDAPTGWLVDAMGGRGAMDAGIKPLAPGRFVGTALTCWCGPNDNLALMAAVSLADPGDVLVAANGAWAIVCFVVPAEHRRRGVAAQRPSGRPVDEIAHPGGTPPSWQIVPILRRTCSSGRMAWSGVSTEILFVVAGPTRGATPPCARCSASRARPG